MKRIEKAPELEKIGYWIGRTIELDFVEIANMSNTHVDTYQGSHHQIFDPRVEPSGWQDHVYWQLLDLIAHRQCLP